MTSKRDPEAESRGADTPEDLEDDIEEVKRPELEEPEKAQQEESKPEPEAEAKPKAARNPSHAHEEKAEEEEDDSGAKSPAYVAPIPKIPKIMPISMASIHVPAQTRPKLPKFVGSFLQGKKVDEVGDIVDERTGQVLARAAGDLPAMAGRTVSNREGDILGDDGELLGYVADLGIERKPSVSSSSASPRTPRHQRQSQQDHLQSQSQQQQQPPTPGAGTGAGASGSGATQSLAEYMGKQAGAFRVDPFGNILDTSGNSVGRFHDNNNPLHRYIREEEKLGEKTPLDPNQPKPAVAEAAAEGKESETKAPEKEANEDEGGAGAGGEQPPKRENAASYRKEDDSPSDIFLDVKSTRDGIQLTIRIPTVFGGKQVQPHIQFS